MVLFELIYLNLFPIINTYKIVLKKLMNTSYDQKLFSTYFIKFSLR